LIAVRETSPVVRLAGSNELDLSAADYFTFREENRTFEGLGLWTSNRVTVTGLDAPEQVSSVLVTADTLPTLGIPPALGRWFSEKDDTPSSPKTIVLSHEYWQRKFAFSDRSQHSHRRPSLPDYRRDACRFPRARS